jgi:predicted Zn-dependent protease
MNRADMFELLRKVMDRVSVPDAILRLTESRSATVRFGQNRITQNTDSFERKLWMQLGKDLRHTELTTHCIDANALGDLVEHGERLLDTAPEDPEYVPPVEGGQEYRSVDDWDQATAGMLPETRVDAARTAVESAAGKGMEAAGVAEASCERTAVFTSTGNMAFHPRTNAEFRLTMDADGASSYRALRSNAWSDLSVGQTVDEVLNEAAMAKNPRPVETDLADLVLLPQAVGDLLSYVVYTLNARLADEGITAFEGMEGKPVTGERLTLSSRLDGPVKGRAFDGEGLPCTDVTWIDSGVLRSMMCDRYWAGESGRRPIASPGCFYLDGSADPLSRGLSELGSGILIRRFWYIRLVDEKTLTLTGMTRDGVFAVKAGKIDHPLEDFRWNWRPLELFERMEWCGTPVRKGWFQVPPMVLRNVDLSL